MGDDEVLTVRFHFNGNLFLMGHRCNIAMRIWEYHT